MKLRERRGWRKGVLAGSLAAVTNWKRLAQTASFGMADLRQRESSE